MSYQMTQNILDSLRQIALNLLNNGYVYAFAADFIEDVLVEVRVTNTDVVYVFCDGREVFSTDSYRVALRALQNAF